MSRQLTTQNAFCFAVEDIRYSVTLIGLKNDPNGNRRYEAIVIDLDDLLRDDRASGAFRYRFTGHCMRERDEAEFALTRLHLKDCIKD